MNNVNSMYYQNYNNVNDITNIQNEEKLQKDLTSVSNGFKRGNIFVNLYWPYKKQTYNFMPRNERQKMLVDIMENAFYAHELKLYLDNFKDDKKKLELFNKYNKKAKDLIKEYNLKYEPITIIGNEFNDIPFSWVESPWPWEGV